MRQAGVLAQLGIWVALASAPLFLGDYVTSLLTYVGLSAIVALGLVLLTGHAGLPSFGQAAFAGISAYTAAILTLDAGLSPWLTLPVSLAATGAVAWGGGLVAIRLSGHYLSLATIAFAAAMFSLAGGLGVTGGQNGLSGLPPLSAFGTTLVHATPYYLIILVVLATLMGLLRNLLNSRMGRAIRTLKDGEAMAEAMGVNTRAAKTAVFVLAGLLAGFVGWFYVYFQRFVNPSPFSLEQGIDYLFMTVLGGANMLWGAVAGAAVVTLLKPALQSRMIGLPGNIEGVVFGGIIILLFQFAADGLLPRLRRIVGVRAGHRARSPADVSHHEAAMSVALPSRVRGRTTLSVEGARKAFGGILANDDVSLSVKDREIVAVIGPNGAGKSTFFDLISGVTRPDAGVFSLDGRPLTGCNSREIARFGVSRSFQHVRLIADMNVIDNVAVGAHARGRRGILASMLRLNRTEESGLLGEAFRQLHRVGLADLAYHEAGSLALGQQRIVEIARALAADPLILLLDEPAAGLRHQEKRILADLLDSLRADGIGVLLVEHDMDFVMNLADRVVVMEFGRVIASGSPEAVQSDPLVREAYLGAPG